MVGASLSMTRMILPEGAAQADAPMPIRAAARKTTQNNLPFISFLLSLNGYSSALDFFLFNLQLMNS
jgi:hypothetical protein